MRRLIFRYKRLIITWACSDVHPSSFHRLKSKSICLIHFYKNYTFSKFRLWVNSYKTDRNALETLQKEKNSNARQSRLKQEMNMKEVVFVQVISSKIIQFMSSCGVLQFV